MIVTTMEPEGALPEWVELLPAGPRLQWAPMAGNG